MWQSILEAQPWKRWNWMHYGVLGLVVFLTLNEVYNRHNERIEPVQKANIETMEENIQEYNTMAEQLAQLEKLPPVSEQWAYAKAVVSNFKLEMTPIDGGKGTYDGPLASWSGRLSGHTGQVLAAAEKIQETVPAYLYGLKVNGDNAQLTFSILGSE